jgi:hypothetical protein
LPEAEDNNIDLLQIIEDAYIMMKLDQSLGLNRRWMGSGGAGTS